MKPRIPPLRSRVLRHAVVALAAVLLASINAPALAQDAKGDRQGGRDAWVAPDEIGALYTGVCSVCHGANLDGAAQGPSLVAPTLAHGSDVDSLVASISGGNPGKGMPMFAATLDPDEIRSLAIYLLEKRARPLGENDQGVGPLPLIPTDRQTTELHDYRLEIIAEGRAHPYSIAPLPDGRVLLTERARGLVLLSRDGESEVLISGTPKAYADGEIRGNTYTGVGWLLDVQLHPDYARNGWIYLSYGARCEACNDQSLESGKPVSMVALNRGRIRDGKWIDDQVLFMPGESTFSETTELAAGARIAFDGRGHVFLSVGAKGDYKLAQLLDGPEGKILRLHDDGRIPEDNPFVGRARALPAVYSYGHRNPQGLAFDTHGGLLWSSEHGPRGGDEANVILAGRNYGWPVVSLGLDYDGRPIGAKYDLDVDPATLEPPRFDWTPSIGVSSIDFYRGDAFPKWRNNLLVATLSRNELRRYVIEDGQFVHGETLLDDLSRIRDVEVGADGFIYLLLEHNKGTRIVCMRPVD